MKVLYIGHYKEFGGWGRAATDQILALDKAGVDVVCRNITLTRDRQNLDPKLLELESKSVKDCDVCIQHVLPHHLVGAHSFKKNIAFLEAETYSIKPLAWFEQLKQMDEIWVANEDLKNSLDRDGIGVPVTVVHHATDIEKYQKRYRPLNISGIENCFKFYYAGDMNDRKNLESIVSCFHSEFDKSEDVALIMKVKKFGHSPEQTQSVLDANLAEVKKRIRIYDDISEYRREIVISNEVTEEEMMSIHQYCDCFVCPTHGEAWSIPSLDAMAFGNTPICSNFGGPKEFITEEENTGKLIDGVFSVCRCSDSAFPDMFTGREYWFQPCEKQIREQMRAYYDRFKENPVAYKVRPRAAGMDNVKRFSHEKIGERMLEVLNES